MATQLVNSRYGQAMLAELLTFPEDMDVWMDNTTRVILIGDDIDNNPDYDATYYCSVGHQIKIVKEAIDASEIFGGTLGGEREPVESDTDDDFEIPGYGPDEERPYPMETS